MTEKTEMENENNELKENPFSQEIEQDIDFNEKKEEQQKVNDDINENPEIDDLKTRCQKLEEQLEEKKGQYVRLAADFDNYRKRQAQERESLLKYGAEDTLKKLLPILDTIERAEKSFNEIDDCQQLKESFEAIKKQISDTLEKIGLEKIETVGKEFDPNLHEAIMQTPTDEQEDHHIIAEMQSGYKLHERTIRPAMVNVAVKE